MIERFDLLVIGAGAAGLTAAGGAAMAGLRVALVEGGEMGGECLHTGCVPSKALLAAAARAAQGGVRGGVQGGVRGGMRLGVELGSAQVDFAAVRAHVDGAIAALSGADSAARFEAMGVVVVRARARFLDRRTVEAGGRRFSAARFVLATGSRPALPEIEGLAAAAPLTTDSVFRLAALPAHLLVLGGGAVGLELAQAFRRLGAAVTLIEPGPVLSRDDREAAALVLARLCEEGVRVVAARAVRVEGGDGVRVWCEDGASVSCSHLLVATGRQANVEDMGLDQAGVAVGPGGIRVDDRRRTSNRRIYAIGDCRQGPRFTHVAGYEGGLVLRELALGLPARVDWRALPRVTYTDPELAQVGLTEAEARGRHAPRPWSRHRPIAVTRQDFATNDRAVCEGETRGFLRLVRAGGRVVGVTIVGAGAGELLLPWVQVVTGSAGSLALASAMLPYPTRGDISRAAAFAAWQPTLFGRWPRRWARALAWLRARGL